MDRVGGAGGGGLGRRLGGCCCCCLRTCSLRVCVRATPWHRHPPPPPPPPPPPLTRVVHAHQRCQHQDDAAGLPSPQTTPTTSEISVAISNMPIRSHYVRSLLHQVRVFSMEPLVYLVSSGECSGLPNKQGQWVYNAMNRQGGVCIEEIMNVPSTLKLNEMNANVPINSVTSGRCPKPTQRIENAIKRPLMHPPSRILRAKCS